MSYHKSRFHTRKEEEEEGKAWGIPTKIQTGGLWCKGQRKGVVSKLLDGETAENCSEWSKTGMVLSGERRTAEFHSGSFALHTLYE